MRYARLVIAIFVGRFFATALYFPEGDGDLGWQRWLGRRVLEHLTLPGRLGAETFTASGAAWVPQEWLFSVLAYASGTRAWPLFAGLCAACASLALVASARTAVRRGAHPVAIALTCAAAGVALFESFGVRVQVLAWPLVALFVLVLESDGPLAYAAIPIAILWANVHASVMLAPAIAGVTFAGGLLDHGWGLRARRELAIAVGAALATCASPLGWKIPAYAVYLFTSPFKSMITEWKHTDIGDWSFACGALPLLACIVLFGLYGKTPWRDRLLFVVFAWLMLSAARNVAVFALVAMPLAARALTSGVAYLRDRASDVATATRLVRFGEPAFAVVLAFAVGTTLVAGERAGKAPDTQPRAALAAIEGLPGTRNVFCADFAWCSFLLDAPHARVFLDGRADPYPQAVWTDFGTIVRVKPAWRRTLRDRNVDVVLVARNAPLEAALSLVPAWHSVYVDTDYRVWARTTSTTNAIVAIRTIQHVRP